MVVCQVGADLAPDTHHGTPQVRNLCSGGQCQVRPLLAHLPCFRREILHTPRRCILPRAYLHWPSHADNHMPPDSAQDPSEGHTAFSSFMSASSVCYPTIQQVQPSPSCLQGRSMLRQTTARLAAGLLSLSACQMRQPGPRAAWAASAAKGVWGPSPQSWRSPAPGVLRLRPPPCAHFPRRTQATAAPHIDVAWPCASTARLCGTVGRLRSSGPFGVKPLGSAVAHLPSNPTAAWLALALPGWLDSRSGCPAGGRRPRRGCGRFAHVADVGAQWADGRRPPRVEGARGDKLPSRDSWWQLTAAGEDSDRPTLRPWHQP